MQWQQIIQPAATLTTAFLGPYLAFRLARRHQEKKDELARQEQEKKDQNEQALEQTKQTLLLLASYEDPHFSNRRITLAEFQRDWKTKKDTIVNIVFPPKGQTVEAFFSDSSDSAKFLRQHQNVNRFLAFLSMLVLYEEKELIDKRVLQIFIPRYNAYRPFINKLRGAVDARCLKEEKIPSPLWCEAVTKLEKILELPEYIENNDLGQKSSIPGVMARLKRRH
jgi:hypothetical protein